MWTVSQILVLCLIGIAAWVAVGLMRKRNMWKWIILYGGWADAEEEYVEMDHPVLGGADAQECCGLFEVVIQSVRNDK